MQLMSKVESTNEKEMFIYTEEQLMARLKFFIGVCLALTLTGIVFVVLYSLIFVTQPMNAIAPIDQKFFELIIPIATFLTGTLSGIMLAGSNKELQQKALEAATRSPSVSSGPASSAFGSSTGGFSANASFGNNSFSFNKSPAATPSAFGPAPTGFKPMAKPASTGPIDDDFMPPRDDE